MKIRLAQIFILLLLFSCKNDGNVPNVLVNENSIDIQCYFSENKIEK